VFLSVAPGLRFAGMCGDWSPEYPCCPPRPTLTHTPCGMKAVNADVGRMWEGGYILF
jgi:hypothetical protein